ncbi:MAG: hypothetical protein WAM13_17875 [Candidatus Sulfotelmatobacter sp.]|jgi:hypothetical protein
MLKQCLLLSTLGFIGLLAALAVGQNPGDPANIANTENIINNQKRRPLCQECTNLRACTIPVSSSAWYQNGHFDPAKRTKELSKQLKLTAHQQSQMLDTLESTKSQLEAVQSDRSLSRKVRNCKLAVIRQASNDQISAFLEKKQNAELARIRSYKYNVDRSPPNWGP